MSGIFISLTGNQNNVDAFFVNVFASTISSWTFFNKCDIYNLICVFIHVKKTFKALLCQMCGKRFKKNKEIAKHMQKRHKHILVCSQRYQDSRHLLQNPTDPNYVMSFSNRAQNFTGSNYLDVDSPFGSHLSPVHCHCHL